jgi:hypothetical protein
VLPPDWGGYFEDGGSPLDPVALAWAGSVIAARAEAGAGALSSGLETALAVARELGRLVADAGDPFAIGAPSPGTLDAVARLARLVLRVSAAGKSRSPGELEYLLPYRLTQSVVHAGRDEYLTAPGAPSWPEWLGIVLTSVADLIDEAQACDVVPPGSPRDQGEAMEFSARSVVTTCVLALALFGHVAAVELGDHVAGHQG